MGSTGVPVTDPEVTEVRLAPDICALSRSESKRLAPENCAFFKSAFGPTRYAPTKSRPLKLHPAKSTPSWGTAWQLTVEPLASGAVVPSVMLTAALERNKTTVALTRANVEWLIGGYFP